MPRPNPLTRALADTADAINHMLEQITATRLDDLHRRNTHTAARDGWGTGRDYADDGARPQTDDDPTSSAALANLQPNPATDPILKDTAAILQSMRTITAEAKKIMSLDDRIRNNQNPRTPDKPAGAGDCAACDTPCPGGDNRLRSGLCDRCRKAFARALATAPTLTRPDWISRQRANTTQEQAA